MSPGIWVLHPSWLDLHDATCKDDRFSRHVGRRQETGHMATGPTSLICNYHVLSQYDARRTGEP